MNKILSDKEFPEHVFEKKFEKYLFVEISEALCNQMVELMLIVKQVLLTSDSKTVLAYELNKSQLTLIKSMNVTEESHNKMAEFFTKYRDQFGIPYYCQVASLVFIDDKQELCIYGNRQHDICLIGCKSDIYNHIKAIQTKNESNQYFLNFIDVMQFIETNKGYFNSIEEENIFILNYS